MSLHAQRFEDVFPRPQVITSSGQTIALPQTATYTVGRQATGSHAYDRLKTWLATRQGQGSLKIVMGVRGDKTVKRFERQIPQHPEGYYLSVGKREIVVAGHDLRGLFYGVQTLVQSAANGRWPMGTVTDYPDVPRRGVVEGFYGTPWSFADRMSQLEFYGRHKLNVYIYGPKDDPYHRVPHWRDPYPEPEGDQIRKLVEQARRHGVSFYWAIHPGEDIRWNETDRDLLLAKFERMYQLGVRGFAVFFDDISGEGTKASKQVELLNYIDNHFVKPKKDVEPLVMCPTEYNKSWANIRGGYLPTLGQKLNENIEIMWTGQTVVDCIDRNDMEWINPHIRRKAYIWFNFPVSDYVRDHLLMGPVYGNGQDIAPLLAGFLSNPMEHAEASKVALSSVADYTWNMQAYDSIASWRNGMCDLLPGDADALETFASHSADLGDNGHHFARNESWQIRESLARIAQTAELDPQAVAAVGAECRQLARACNRLMGNRENPRLIDQMRPWLEMGKLVGEYGVEVMRLAGTQTDRKAFEEAYRQARALQAMMYDVDSKQNQNPYQPGVKVGSLILMPTLNKIFTAMVDSHNARYGTSLASTAVYMPFTMSSNVPQLTHLATRTRGALMTVSPSNEVIKWAKGGELKLEFDAPLTPKSLRIDMGKPDVAPCFRLEVMVDGIWRTVSLTPAAQGNVLTAQPMQSADKATALRLTQTAEPEVQVYFREFTLETAR